MLFLFFTTFDRFLLWKYCDCVIFQNFRFVRLSLCLYVFLCVSDILIKCSSTALLFWFVNRFAPTCSLPLVLWIFFTWYVPTSCVSRSRPSKETVEPSEDPDSDEDDEDFVSSKSQVAAVVLRTAGSFPFFWNYADLFTTSELPKNPTKPEIHYSVSTFLIETQVFIIKWYDPNDLVYPCCDSLCLDNACIHLNIFIWSKCTIYTPASKYILILIACNDWTNITQL